MITLKLLIYSGIFLSCSFIGILVSRKYVNRVEELKEFKTALNIFKTKIRYTYEPIPDIFMQISENINPSVSTVFSLAANKMDILAAGEAWDLALKMDALSINDEDRSVLKSLSKLLGKTDIQGQLNQIEMTEDFIDKQIYKAEKEREKNERMYRTLGAIIGITIVIIVM